MTNNEINELRRSYDSLVNANVEIMDMYKMEKEEKERTERIIHKLEKHLLYVYESFITSENEHSYIVATESKVIYDYLQKLKNEIY